MSAVFDWALLSIGLFESGAERHAEKVVERLHCEYFDVRESRSNLKSMIFCTVPVRESSS